MLAPLYVYPSVDEFGTVRWPSRKRVRQLLVCSEIDS